MLLLLRAKRYTLRSNQYENVPGFRESRYVNATPKIIIFPASLVLCLVPSDHKITYENYMEICCRFLFCGFFFSFVFFFPGFQVGWGGKCRGPLLTACLGRASKLQNGEGHQSATLLPDAFETAERRTPGCSKIGNLPKFFEMGCNLVKFYDKCEALCRGFFLFLALTLENAAVLSEFL